MGIKQRDFGPLPPVSVGPAWIGAIEETTATRLERIAAIARSSTLRAGWRGPNGRSASPGQPSASQRRSTS
jgi:hypothetical protein